MSISEKFLHSSFLPLKSFFCIYVSFSWTLFYFICILFSSGSVPQFLSDYCFVRSNILFMCQEYIDYSWLLHLHTNYTIFRIILSISNSKNIEKLWILIEITLNILANLWRICMFTICCYPVHGHWISFYLFRASVYLNNIL